MGHLPGAYESVGLGFGALERKATLSLSLPFLQEPHPLGGTYQSTTLQPVLGPEVRRMLARPPQPRPTGVPILDLILTRAVRRLGHRGVRALTNALRRAACTRSRPPTVHDVTAWLGALGLPLGPAEAEHLEGYLDPGLTGTISLPDAILALQGDAPAHRMELVHQAYCNLLRCCDGFVTRRHMEQLYGAQHHPEVLAGRRTPQQALQDFIEDWEPCAAPDDRISEELFGEYYRDLSAGIADDPYFSLLVRNPWHVSGGEGPGANTSCRRVAVVHTDGRESVEEVCDDLGVPACDQAAVLQRLRAQGVTDIQRFRCL